METDLTTRDGLLVQILSAFHEDFERGMGRLVALAEWGIVFWVRLSRWKVSEEDQQQKPRDLSHVNCFGVHLDH